MPKIAKIEHHTLWRMQQEQCHHGG